MSKPLDYYLGLTTGQLISEFERELSAENMGRFYRWLGIEFDTRMDEIELACKNYMESSKTKKDRDAMHMVMCEHYKYFIEMARWYKKQNGIDETKIFLQSLIIE